MVVSIISVGPNTHDRNQVIPSPNEGIENEKQEESLILEPNTIISEEAVVVHLKDAGLANRAVISPCWLYFIAFFAFLIPE